MNFPVGLIFVYGFFSLEFFKNVYEYTLISGNYYYYYMREGSITTKPFSSKDMDYIEVMDQVRDYTLTNFPIFEEELSVRLAYAYLSIFNQLIQIDGYKKKKEYSILKNKILAIWSKIIASSNAPKNLKIAVLLLKFNEKIYKFVLNKYKKYENND